MKTVVEAAVMETSEENTTTNDYEGNDLSSITHFWDSRSDRSLKTKAQSMKTWLETGSKEVTSEVAFLGEQVLIDLFIKYNTAIPSSAAVERLFSKGKDILRAMTATLSDGNFERLMLMKDIQHHIKVIEKAQPE
nr:uncharacterized protein LOC128705794 [Cherax quadricarinatus]